MSPPTSGITPDNICDFKIEMYKGRNRTIRVTVTTTTVGDITGSKLWFSVKKDDCDLDANALITKLSANNGGSDADALIVDGPNRIVEFYIVPTDTFSIDPGDYSADAVIELSSGSRLQLLPPMTFTILQPITVTSPPP